MVQVVEKLFDAIARLRHARVFHPEGIRLTGHLRAAPEFERFLGSGDRPVSARVSKTVSTPGRLPDAVGLALSFPAAAGERSDFALASTLTGLVGRFVLAPTLSWRDARYGSLMPYRVEGRELLWIVATPDGSQPENTSLEALSEHARTHQLRFTLTAGTLRGEPGPFAEVTVGLDETAQDEPFDPTLHHPRDVQLAPAWVSRIRQQAYEGSRDGRGAKPPRAK